MRFAVLLLVVGTLLLGVVVVPYVREFSAVDTCLDRGGSYNYASATCVMEGPPYSHPVIPFFARHSLAKPTMIAGGAFILIGLFLWRRRA